MADLVSIGFKADSRGIVTAGKELDTLARKGGGADKSLNKLERTAKTTTKAINALGIGLSALSVAALARGVTTYSDNWANLNTQLKLVIDSEEQLIKTRTKLIELSRETNSDLSGTVELFAELTRNSEALGKSEKDLLGVTKTINQLFLAGGKAASETAGAIRQFNQALSMGALRSEEFNSVSEGAPKILDALASSLGMARGELRGFAATGGITSAVLIQSLQDYADEAEEMASKVEATFSKSITNASTNISEYIGTLDTARALTADFGGGIESLTANLEHLDDALLVGVSTLSLGLIPAMVTFTATQLGLAKAALFAGTAVTVEANALGVVTTTAATATVATNALRISTNLLLGPIGLVVTALGFAAIAYNTSKKAAEEAEAQEKRHLGTLDLLINKYTKVAEAFGNKSLGLDYVKAQKAAMKIEADRAKLQDKLSASIKSTTLATGLYTGSFQKLQEEAALREQIKGLNDDLAEQEAIMKAVGVVFDNGITKMDGWVQRIKDGVEVSDKLNKSTAKGLTFYERTVAALDMQSASLLATADAFELYKLEMDAIANGTAPHLIEELVKLAKANQDIRNSIAADEGLEDSIAEIENYGGAWSATGNIIVDTFGDMSSALDDYTKRLSGLDKIQSDIDKQALTLGKDNIKVIQAQTALDDERFKAQVGGLSDVAGASAKLFSEQTTARKSLHALEVGLSAVEIALSLQKTGASVAAGAAKIFEQSGWLGFAGVGAMIAVMAGLGFSGGSGGGSQSAPESTALGSSDPSQSLSNSNSIIEDILIDQLGELRSIDDNLKGVDTSVQNVNLSVARGDDFWNDIRVAFDSNINGRFTNFGGERAALAAGTGELSGAARLSIEVENAFDGISSTINNSLESLGVSALDASLLLKDLSVEVDFSGLTLDEKLTRIKEVFNESSDVLTEQAAPALLEFQQLGEGLFETLVRVNVEQASFNDLMNNLGMSLGSVSAIDQIGIAQNIIDLSGGLDKFKDASESLLDNFFTDAERFGILQDSLTDVFDGLGFALVDSKEEFRDLISGIDLTSESGQELYATLLKINPALSDYIKQVEGLEEERLRAAEQSAEEELRIAEGLAADKLKIANLQGSLEIQLLQLQGNSEAALALQREKILANTDESLTALQLQIFAEQDLAKTRDDSVNAIDKQKSAMEGLIGGIQSALGTAKSTNVINALQAARGGDFGLAENLDFNKIANLTSAGFSSSTQLKLQQAANTNSLNQISMLAQDQVTDFDRQINVLTNMSVSQEELVAEVKQMREEQKAAGLAIAANAVLQTKALVAIEQDGLDVRIEETP